MTLKKQLIVVMMIIGAMMSLLLIESTVMLDRINSGIAQREYNDEPYEAALVFKYHVAQIQQFATDASATGDAGSLDEAKTHFEDAIKQLDAIEKALPEQVNVITKIRQDLNAFHETGIRMANTYIQEGQEAGNAVMKASGDGFDDRASALTGSFDSLFQHLESVNNQLKQNLAQTERTGRLLMITTQLALFAVVMGVLVLGSRRILRLIGGDPSLASEVAQRISAGDMTVQIQGNPPADSLLATMATMRDNLKETVGAIRASARAVLESAEQLDQESARCWKVPNFRTMRLKP